jgi:hypothetical protein
LDHPIQVFNRIRRRKARPDLPRPGLEPVVPAPVQPASVPSQPPAPSIPVAPATATTESAAPTRPPRGHALYSQVMRSHDRMGTRHL